MDDQNVSPGTLTTRKDYTDWSKKHTTMTSKPPADGRDYLRHARNLIPLLESVAELHPFAKAIVFSFKAVVMYENDRRENDARVASVFLAQSDMMRVLLDLDKLGQRRQELFDETDGEPQDQYKELSDRISEEINSCGNSIDTYYKESRLVKFCKSGEWKGRMLGYVESFNNYRLVLQQTLQIQVASGVDDLNAKMSVVLARLFNTHYDWETKLLTQTHKLGNPSRWTNNPKILQQLLSMSNDHAINPSVFDPQTSKPPSAAGSTVVADADTTSMDWNKNFVESIREELHTSIEVLCNNNKELFQTKLNLHAQRIEDSISKSAQSIIRALSGPYDRLDNEDLRSLWKEMNWIFCVENKLFTMALFEYYLDHMFAFEHNQPKQEKADADATSTEPPPQATHTIGDSQKLKHLHHPDSWTLEYISTYGSRISGAIDVDNSGYIRISEANTFTDQMPKGWNLPQWCAYNAVGWFYELRIYQMRMNQLFMRMCELQAEILPANRSYVSLEVSRIIRLFFPLSRHIEGSGWQDPPTELSGLIKDKIFQQDAKYKKVLEMFKFGIDAESTIHLIFEGKDLESYILPFATLMLEHWLELIELCTRETLDIREWNWVEISATNVRGFIINRISDLRAQFKTERGPDSVADAMTTFYGGLYSNFYRLFFLHDDDAEGCSYNDILAYQRNLSLLDDYPFPPVTEKYTPVLRYESWEDYLVTEDSGDEPEKVPPAWGDFDGPQDIAIQNSTWMERGDEPFPFQNAIYCNKCKAYPFYSARYYCLICDDFDLCDACYHDPESDGFEGHLKSHATVKMTLAVPSPLGQWLAMLGYYHHESLIQDLHSKVSGVKHDESELVTGLTCDHCAEAIDTDGIFYACVGHTCQDCHICPNCVNAEAAEPRIGHQPWHTLVVLRDLDLSNTEDADDGALSKADASESVALLPTVTAKIDELETRMKLLETRVDTGLADIKNLFEQLLARMSTQNTRSPPAPTSGALRSLQSITPAKPSYHGGNERIDNHEAQGGDVEHEEEAQENDPEEETQEDEPEEEAQEENYADEDQGGDEELDEEYE